MGTFDIPQNDFLVFEEGPSQGFTLQWATYRDASDQTSLSRIWGGIHPPIDDIRGRIIGEKIGLESFNLALQYFNGTLSTPRVAQENEVRIYPVPFSSQITLKTNYSKPLKFQLFGLDGKKIIDRNIETAATITFDLPALSQGIYFAKLINDNNEVIMTKKIVKN